MAHVILTMKLMPEDPDVNLGDIKDKVEHIIKEFQGNVKGFEEEPVGFGLVALKVTFSRNEDLGSPDDIEEKINELPEVSSVQVVSVSRALG